MIPKSDLFGAVPPARGNDAAAIHPQLPTAALNIAKDFSAIVSQAIAKRPEQPRTSATPRADLLVQPEQGEVAAPGIGLEGKDRVPTALAARGENLPEIGFYLVTKAVTPAATTATSKGKSRETVPASPSKGDSPQVQNTDTSHIHDHELSVDAEAQDKAGAGKVDATTTATTQKGKSREAESTAPVKDVSVDSSMLSGVMALLVPPEAFKPQVQNTALSQRIGDDLTVRAESEDKTSAHASKDVYHSRLSAPVGEADSEEDAPRKNAALPDMRPPAHGEEAATGKLESNLINTKPDEAKTSPPPMDHAALADSPAKASISASTQAGQPAVIAGANVSNAPPDPPSPPENGPPAALQQVDSKNVPKEALKGGDPPAAIDGTPAALPKQRMKFAGEKNDIAGRAVQNLPNASAADDSTSNSGSKAKTQVDPIVPRHSRESFIPGPLGYFASNPSLIDAVQGKSMDGAQAVNTAAVQVERVAQLVSQEVFMVRQSGANALAVSLKVDSQTELFLQLTSHNGQIQASLRCDRGNVEGLDSHWAELQQSLAQQNVQLMPFDNRTAPSGAALFTQGSGNVASRPFDQSSQDRQSQFRDPHDEAPTGRATVAGRVSGKTRTNNRSRQGWEKWA